MWPFKRKKVKQRRLEIRKAIRPTGGSLWRRFRQAGGLESVLLAAAFCAGVILMDAWPPYPRNHRVGQYLPRDVYARVPFQVLSQGELESERRKILTTTPPTFRINEELRTEIGNALRALPGRLAAATQPADLDEDLRARLGVDSADKLDAWRALSEPQASEAYVRRIDRMLAELPNLGVVRPEALAAQRQQRDPSFAILRYGEDRSVESIDALVPLDEPQRLERAVDQLAERFAPAIRGGVRSTVLATFRDGGSLYVYDEQATRQDITRQLDKLAANPPGRFYQPGDRLAERTRPLGREGPHAGLTAKQLAVLEAEHEAHVDYLREREPLRMWLHVLGRAGLILLIVATLCVYIARYKPRVVQNHLRGLAIAALLLLLLGVNKAIVQATGWNPHLAVFAVIMGAVILTIAYDQRFAFAVTFILAVLVTLQMRADVPMLIVLATGLGGMVFQLQEIRTRSKLIAASAVTSGVLLVAVWSMALAEGRPWRFALVDSAWAAGGALLAGFIAQGILPAIERVFRVVTSMTLLEWCDASKPLLKRLAIEAPGTYNHSLQLGTMCEAAAEAIGARGLFARVGAYYHDIGKIAKSPYFIENQSDSRSRHAKLSPAMSLLVITGHVKDGLEMAREYGLPPVLHEFIATHHGTTLVEYFYHAAAEQRKSDTERAPDEVEFRYPGPKPRSREAAILMLADAAESSVRAISEPTPNRIETQVHTMVSRRLTDGQLDNCDLTLREVHVIEQSLIKSLCGFYHARISYPSRPGQKPAPSESEKGEQDAEDRKAREEGERRDEARRETAERVSEEA